MPFEMIIKYYLGELSDSEKEVIEKYLMKQPYHFEILEGLSKIESELKDGQSIRDYLNRKKQFIYKAIFDK